MGLQEAATCCAAELLATQRVAVFCKLLAACCCYSTIDELENSPPIHQGGTVSTTCSTSWLLPCMPDTTFVPAPPVLQAIVNLQAREQCSRLLGCASTTLLLRQSLCWV
jgi:hypothetical protein